MTQARKTVVSVEESGVYHCVSRCVRRAFLCGLDSYTGRNYEHRRGWVRDRLKDLSGLFGVEVFSYAVMSNHTHVVLRTRPDWVEGWSDEEVAVRWCSLFRGKAALQAGKRYDEAKYERLCKDPQELGRCRARLKNLSWFMRCLNESLARRANREDKCTGRFWEGRFKCQRLMDEGAMLACMAYVDLNPVRARLAEGLGDSHFTSIYDRIVSQRARRRLEMVQELETPTLLQEREILKEKKRIIRSAWLLDFASAESPFIGLDEAHYLSLVEWTGRTIRADKPGYIPAGLQGTLDRFGLDAKGWAANVENYGSLFHRIAGPLECLLSFAAQRGQRWFRGRAGSQRLYERPGEAA